jgi:hypothetical protein
MYIGPVGISGQVVLDEFHKVSFIGENKLGALPSNVACTFSASIIKRATQPSNQTCESLHNIPLILAYLNYLTFSFTL